MPRLWSGDGGVLAPPLDGEGGVRAPNGRVGVLAPPPPREGGEGGVRAPFGLGGVLAPPPPRDEDEGIPPLLLLPRGEGGDLVLKIITIMIKNPYFL